ncbi:MAG: ABC transporter substrate-binding protein [Patescibacteria group bacterium]
MTKTIKIIVGIVVIILIIWGLASLGGDNQPATTNEPIKIGVIAPLTGPGAIFGNSVVGGIELAMIDLGAARTQYKLIIEDDGTNPTKSASAAQKLIEIDKVQAIISGTSGTAQAIKPLVANAGIVQICVACTDVTIADSQFNFTNSILGEDEARAWVGETVRRGLKKIAILTQNHPGVNAAADQVKKQAENAGLQIVHEERFAGDLRDFKTIIAKTKQAAPEIIFLRAFPPAMDILGAELITQNVAQVSTGGGAFAIVADPSIFEGRWYVDAGLTDRSFVERFSSAYPGTRFNTLAAPYAYDSFMMLSQGLKSGGSASAYLKSLKNYDGKAGRLEQNENGNFRSDPSIWIIKNGKPALVTF